MKTLFIYSLMVIFLCVGCGSTKDSSSATINSDAAVKSDQNMATTANNQKDALKQENNFRLIVSFISIGEGTDASAREKMEGVLHNWEVKNGKAVEMENVPWGREGEVDFCFKLNDLKEEETTLFVDEMKMIFKDNSLVQISENQPCMHKR